MPHSETNARCERLYATGFACSTLSVEPQALASRRMGVRREADHEASGRRGSQNLHRLRPRGSRQTPLFSVGGALQEPMYIRI